MSNHIEIRWHGRGGQGAKTAALMLADVAFQTGKYVQGFPEYGPERMGAPITAYNRISDTPIRVHSNIYDPEYVVVVDETLLEAVDVTAGLREDGAIIVNTERTKEEIMPHLKGYKGDVYIIDAIGLQTLEDLGLTDIDLCSIYNIIPYIEFFNSNFYNSTSFFYFCSQQCFRYPEDLAI